MKAIHSIPYLLDLTSIVTSMMTVKETFIVVEA